MPGRSSPTSSQYLEELAQGPQVDAPDDESSEDDRGSDFSYRGTGEKYASE